MRIVKALRANRLVHVAVLLVLACGCNGGAATEGPAPDSAAKQSAESAARKAAYDGNTIQTKAKPKQ